MPKKPASRLPEDLWTATHQRPEGYHPKKASSKSAKRPLDLNTSKARGPLDRKPAPSPARLLTFARRPLGCNISKAGRPLDRKPAPTPARLMTTARRWQHIKSQKALRSKTRSNTRQTNDAYQKNFGSQHIKGLEGH